MKRFLGVFARVLLIGMVIGMVIGMGGLAILAGSVLFGMLFGKDWGPVASLGMFLVLLAAFIAWMETC